MNQDTFEDLIARIYDVDNRYEPDAYFFMREALEHTSTELRRHEAGQTRHVTGQELSLGIRSYALAEFGPLAHLVLTQWGIEKTSDFGEIVYNLIEAGVLGKTPSDRKEDFRDVYDFDEAFRKPFEPRNPAAFFADK